MKYLLAYFIRDLVQILCQGFYAPTYITLPNLQRVRTCDLYKTQIKNVLMKKCLTHELENNQYVVSLILNDSNYRSV